MYGTNGAVHSVQKHSKCMAMDCKLPVGGPAYRTMEVALHAIIDRATFFSIYNKKVYCNLLNDRVPCCYYCYS